MDKLSTCGNSSVTGSDPSLAFAVYLDLFDHSGSEINPNKL